MIDADELSLVNVGASEIPSFGLARVTGIRFDDESRVMRYEVALPDEEFGQMLVVNGELPIGSDKFGRGTARFPAVVAYDTADGDPAAGDVWGVVPSSTGKLKLSFVEGFDVLGNPVDETLGLVVVRPQPLQLFVGKTAGAITKDDSGDVNVHRWTGTPGSEVDLSITASVFVRFGDIGSTKWLKFGRTGKHFHAITGEC
jgi:hypothetical protein